MDLYPTYIAVCNFCPESVEKSQEEVENSFLQTLPQLLPLWIGEKLRILASHGDWCYGQYEAEPSKCGLFPKSHVYQIDCTAKDYFIAHQKSKSNICETDQLIAEIKTTVKIWWKCVKDRYLNQCGMENNNIFITFIKDLMIIRNKLHSARVPDAELKEIRLLIARKIDLGNHCMGLNMHIRNQLGRIIRAEELSVVNAYRQHESAYAKITSCDCQTAFFDQNISTGSASDKFAILIDINNPIPELKPPADIDGTFEMVLSIVNDRTKHVLNENLTLYWSRSTGRFTHDSCRALLVELSEAEFKDDQLLLTAELLREVLVAEPSSKKNETHPRTCVRHVFASGQLNLSEQLKDIADKEKREVFLNLTKESDPTQTLPSKGNSTKPGNGELTDCRTSLAITFQVMNCSSVEHFQQCYPDIFPQTQIATPKAHSLAILKRLHTFTEANNCSLTADWFRRNEVFFQLGSADLHGNGVKGADRNIESVLTVLDDNGVLVENCFESITPDRIIHSSHYRSRVVLHNDRPRFNEIIKIRLPKIATRNIHLRILFYNRKIIDKTTDPKADKKGDKPEKGPFALCFLHLIKNYVLQNDIEDDELLVYKIEPTKFDDSNVAYINLCASKRQLLQQRAIAPSAGNSNTLRPSQFRSDSATNSSTSLNSSGNNTNNLCIYNEKNTVHFRITVNSSVHTTSYKLLQVLRWRENELTLKDRIYELIGQAYSSSSSLDSVATTEINTTDELLKLLPKFLDAIFEIAEHIPQYQRIVFDAFVYVIRLCEEPKNGRQKTELEQYLELFPSPNAHIFLLQNLIWYVENDSKEQTQKQSRERLVPVLKSLGVLIRLIVISKSRQRTISELMASNSSAEEHAMGGLSAQMDGLLTALSELISNNNCRPTYQNAALKYLPSIIPSLIDFDVYEPLRLAKYILDIINRLTPGVHPRHKLVFLQEIIETDLFACLECRQLLLPKILDQLLALLPPPTSETQAQDLTPFGLSSDNLVLMQLAAQILTDMVERLFPCSRASTVFQRGSDTELQLILFRCIRPLNRNMVMAMALKNSTNPSLQQCQRSLHVLLLALLDQFSAPSFLSYITIHLRTQMDRIDMLSEMLHMFRDLLNLKVVPAEWYQIHHLQHKLIMKHTRFAKAFITQEIEHENTQVSINRQSTESHSIPAVAATIPGCMTNLWLEFLLTLVAFIKQSTVNNAKSESTAHGTNGYYEESTRDMREIAVRTLRSLWFSLKPETKMALIPIVITPVLEVALCEDQSHEVTNIANVKNNSLQEISMPIFFDMFETEYYINLRAQRSRPTSNANVHYRQNDYVYFRTVSGQYNSIKPMNVSRFTEEFIKQLDPLFDNNHGGPGFRAKLKEMLRERLTTNPDLEKEVGREFADKVDKLLELLLNYRQVRVQADCVENGMFCTLQLINFYQEIDQKSLYVDYLYKLHRLHMMLGNTVEAALTLKKHASLLNWNEELVEPYLMASKSRKKQLGDATTHLQLKESIYVEIADLLEKGEHWEQAIEVLKELVPVYESILFDSQQLADLMRRLADLYTKTISTIRMEYNYFLVAFYGKDAPEYLSKRKFIFRGEKLEQWGNFKQRIMSNYFGFKFVESMEDCEDELQDEKGKYIQIVPVTAQPSPKYIELNKSPHRLSRWYYKHHQVLRFEQHRREIRPDTKWTALDSNDATKLWLKRKIISIEKPLPDILKFAQVVNEHELEISNPVEVAMLQMQDVNEALSEEAQLVNAGFDQNIVNLGGRIRGVVQANVGGGVKNYQTFFTKECDQQCTESEKKSIHLLKNVLLEHVAIVEYALYVYTNKSPQGNETFHNLLLQSFNAYKQNIEEQSKQKAPSILPPGANISFDFNSSASEQNSNLTTPNSTTHRPHFSQERSISMTATSEAGTPIANHSTLTSTSTVLFRQVPKAFLRSTMGRGKANIGSPSNTGTPTKKTSLSALGVHATSPVVPSRRASGGPLLPPLHMPGAHEFTLLDPSAFSSPRFSSNSNMSDTVTGGTSTSNASSVVVMSSTLTHPRITAPDPPLLPPRRSSVHSSELRQRKMSVN